VAVFSHQSHDVVDLGVVDAKENRCIGLLEEAARTVQPGRPILALEQGIDEDFRVLVVYNRDD
jgi:hypothetical protein